MIRFNAQLVTLDASADETQPSRTITGLAVPWDVVANLSGDVGPVKFLKGSISVDGPMPKLLDFHDDTRVIGRVTERVASDEGLMFSATLSKTRAADDAMALLADGSISAVSIGAVPIKFKRVDGVMEVSEARMIELSLVSFPAYADAEIQSVYAQAEDEEEIPEEETPPQPSEEDDTMSEPTTVEAAIATQPIYATAKQEFKMPSAGEWMAAQFAGGSVAAEFNARLRAAAPSVTTSDLDGIMPTPIVAPIYSGIQGLRPVVDAIGARAMPAGGKVFIVPKITTHTSIGGPETQNATITAGQFIVDDVQVTKGIYGGYVQLSEASIDWSDPEVLGALLEDLGKKYALFTDDVAADALLTGTTQATGNVAPTDPADWVAKIYACANTILSSGNYLPDHLFIWRCIRAIGNFERYIGQTVISTGRPDERVRNNERRLTRIHRVRTSPRSGHQLRRQDHDRRSGRHWCFPLLRATEGRDRCRHRIGSLNPLTRCGVPWILRTDHD